MPELSTILEKIDRTVFTPEVQKQLEALLESKRNEAEEAGYTRGLKSAEDKVKLVESTAAAKADATDKDHADKLQRVIDKIDTDHTALLENVVTTIDERHTAALKEIVESTDARHTELLEKVLEDIDSKHSKALAMVVEKIDRDHTAKLLAVKDMYESKYEAKMVEAVDKFLDTYLAESAPEATLVDAAKLARLTEMFEGVKKLLVVNEDYVQTEIREAVEDAQAQLAAKDGRIDKLMEEKMELKQKIDRNEARQVLAEKAAALPAKKRLYVEKLFEKADAAEVKARFDEACKAYDNEDDDKRNRLIEESKGSGVVPVIPPAESGTPENGAQDAQMSNYVGAFTKSLNARK